MIESILSTTKSRISVTNRYEFKYDLLRIITLFIISGLFVYYTPSIVNKIYFLGLLVLFWKSKKDYLWFAFIFIILNEPAGFFSGGAGNIIHRIPLYGIGPGLSFTFYDFFIITALIKALNKGKRKRFIFKKPILLLVFYSIVLFLLSFLFGISFKTIVLVMRSLVFLTLFISVLYLINNDDDFYKLIHLIFPFTFLVLFSQLYKFINASELITFFDPERKIEVAYWGEEVRATVTGIKLVFFSLIFSMFFLSKKDYKGNKKYLLLLILAVILIVIISATRSWIMMFGSLLLIYFVFIEKLNLNLLFPSIIFFILITFLFRQLPVMQRAINSGLSRFQTLEYITKGDITAGGTLLRYDVRLPRIMEGIKKNPVTGWGFSNTYYKYSEGGHVGNFDMILQGGIIGFFFFLYFWRFFYIKIFSVYRKLPSHHPNKKSLLVLALGMTGMLILHFTSYQFFGFPGMSMIVILLLVVSNHYLIQSKNYKKGCI